MHGKLCNRLHKVVVCTLAVSDFKNLVETVPPEFKKETVDEETSFHPCIRQ